MTNKIIIDGIKKCLDLKKVNWAENLDGVLWSKRPTPIGETNTTPFSLVYEVQAKELVKVNISSLKESKMPQKVEVNKEMILNASGEIEEHRDQALLQIQNYQHLAERYYNKKF